MLPAMSEMHPSMARLYEAAIAGKIIKGKYPQAELAHEMNTSSQRIKNWEGRGVSKSGAIDAQKILGISLGWVMDGVEPMLESVKSANPSRYTLTEATGDNGAMPITMLDVRGSCGGGSVSWEAEHRLPLMKEPSWFRRFKLRPKDGLAVWADGDSMADYIVDGDIVIFDTSKTDAKSGRIYLIEHPDGLKIKRLRRDIDGAWLLESNNVDKRRFPDERIEPDQADLLKIKGEFVYRQGG